MISNKSLKLSVLFGIIIGLIYVLVLFWRWRVVSDESLLGMRTMSGYAVVVICLIIEALFIRHVQHGVIRLKALFTALIISVLIFEFFCTLFNYIYLKYIDPGLIEKLKIEMLQLLSRSGKGIPDREKQQAFIEYGQLKNNVMLMPMIRNYFSGVVMSGLVAFFASLALRKDEASKTK